MITTTHTPAGGRAPAVPHPVQPLSARCGVVPPAGPRFILAADYLARRRAEGVACAEDTDPSG